MRGWGLGFCGTILALLFLPALVLASGYGINELGAKALGMGGAFAAQADDPSAVYFNPAGIVQLDGTQISIGMSTVTPTATFESNGTSGIPGTAAGQTTDLEDHTFPVPNAYITRKYNDRLSFGFGIFSNFGLATDWPEEWEGRYILGADLARITTTSFNPVLAFRPHDKLSLAFGPVLQYFDIEVKYKIFLPPTLGGPLDISTKLAGDDWDWGWNVGLLVWITERLRFGASYRSEVSHRITDGKASFTPQVPPAPGFSGIQNTSISTSITTPAIAYLGLAWSCGPWTLELDGQWTEWSTFESLTAPFGKPVANQESLEDSFNWKNTWAYRFGVQYALNRHLDLRAGFVRDEQAVPDETFSPLLPSGDRNIYSFGVSGHYQGLTVDFAYNFLDDEERPFNNKKGEKVGPGTGTRVTGTFKDQQAHLFGINFMYRF